MSFLQLPPNQWSKVLPKYLNHQNMVKLNHQVQDLYQNQAVLPEQNSIFKALALTDYPDVKVVILGQDPYPNPNNAMGLAFSVKPDNPKIPFSLQNIYKERQADLAIPPAPNGDLTSWAKNGVLLLNTTLTVQAYQAGSHQNLGWQEFTDAVIKALIDRNRPTVFILWGRQAQAKASMIPKKNPNFLILEASHPSPLSANRSFFGSKPFSKTNEFLTQHHVHPIDWRN